MTRPQLVVLVVLSSSLLLVLLAVAVRHARMVLDNVDGYLDAVVRDDDRDPDEHHVTGVDAEGVSDDRDERTA